MRNYIRGNQGGRSDEIYALELSRLSWLSTRNYTSGYGQNGNRK